MSLRERLTNVMRAESYGLDLKHTIDGITVFAMRKDGTLYELGSVSAEAAAQYPEDTRKTIERIKFTHTNKAS